MLRDKLQLQTDERAVSPVLGVALLIAVTVILAAVIAAVVLGVGAESASSPQASVQFETGDLDGEGDDTDVRVAHEGGDTIEGANLRVTVDGTEASAFTPPTEFTTGDATRAANDVADGATVRLTWEDPSSDKSALIGEFEV